MPEITKNQLKLIRSLSQKKTRKETGLFVIEGTKNVEELINANWEIVDIFTTESFQHPTIKGTPISSKQLSQISSLSQPEGVIAVAKIPVPSEIPSTKSPILVLDNINDPGNLGTIIRTADWFGVNHIICSENTVDCYNQKVVQATKGSLFHIPIYYEDLENVISQFNGIILGASLDGKPIQHLSLTENNIMLVMGSESHGLSNKVESLLTHKVLIPRKGKAESLNVGIATGILLHHLSNQQI